MAIVERKHLRLIGDAGAAPAGWYLSPHGYNLYRVGSGDSLGSIAARFLGDANRADEIWTIQSADWRASKGDDESNLVAGDELYMPQEAIDNAKAAGFASGGQGAAPTKFTGPPKTIVGGTDVLKPSGGGGGGTVVPAATLVPVVPKPTPQPVTPPSSPLASLSRNAKLAIGGGVGVLAGVLAVVALKKPKRANPKRGRRSAIKRFRNAYDGA